MRNRKQIAANYRPSSNLRNNSTNKKMTRPPSPRTPRSGGDEESPYSLSSRQDETFSFIGNQQQADNKTKSLLSCLRSYTFRQRLMYAGVAGVFMLVGALVWMDEGFGESSHKN